MDIRFDNQVAIVTGAGQGMGRSHAIALAERGAHVIVNDIPGAGDESGEGSLADNVVSEIKASGGSASVAHAAVDDADAVKQMVDEVIKEFGQVDILVNNAGILRDRSISKMSVDEFDKIVAVHLRGSFLCTHAVWPHMRERNYGRIVMTSSGSGIFGNFGQSNYGAAKAGVVGMMNSLRLEGEKYDIRINAIVPSAATRMTEGLIEPADLELLGVDGVTPVLLALVQKDAPSREIICCGAGNVSRAAILETERVYLPKDGRTPERAAEAVQALLQMRPMHSRRDAFEQTMGFLSDARKLQKGE